MHREYLGQMLLKARPSRRGAPLGSAAARFRRALAAAAALLVAVPVAGRGQPPEMPPSPVVVAPVVEQEVSRAIDLVGIIAAERRSVVGAQAEGSVKELRFEEGDPVEAEVPLAVLDSGQLELEIESAQAAREELAARHQEAEDRRKRSFQLHEKGRISEEEYQGAMLSAQALQFGVTKADAAVRRLEDRLARLTVRAPFAGFIARKHTEIGEWLTVGGSVAEVMDLEPVHARIELPERYYARIDREAEVLITADAVPDRTFTGRIAAVIPDVDPQSHTVPVKVEIPNEEELLLPGLFVRASLPLGDRRLAMLVPKDALVSRGPANAVFVAASNTVYDVTVQRGTAHGPLVEVTGDLQPGMQVVVRGNERLQPGQSVRITSTDADLAPPTAPDS